ncbi:hypothetical protein HBI38_220410 [Parastagonospora nodorum]|nr:hypothetical protein HBH52_189440 [Parastagonospora nodorum]KAH3994080.1 hypothetical protein HBI10_194560 [Parastagonospora nodorum]KAH4008688.1 hypothetical protein HBI13_231410 [Parastagonospora nodorum]KAH4112144.1 hypothetical protein HBH47_230550 [Parastagonospora nodorum]KAH4251361.1 hypothetical protein HBI03_226560 [Parastagonospora nodorum]
MSDTQSATPSQSPVLSFGEQAIELFQSHWKTLEHEANQIESNLDDKRSDIKDLVNKVEKLNSDFKQFTSELEVENGTTNVSNLLQLREDYSSAKEKLQAARKAYGELELVRAELLQKLRQLAIDTPKVLVESRDQEWDLEALQIRLTTAAQSDHVACCAKADINVNNTLFRPIEARVYTGSREGAGSWKDCTLVLEWFASRFHFAFYKNQKLLFRMTVQDTTYVVAADEKFDIPVSKLPTRRVRGAYSKLIIDYVLPSGDSIEIDHGYEREILDILPIITKAQGEGRCTACEED